MTRAIEFLSGFIGSLVIIAAILWTGVALMEFILKKCRIYALILEFIWHKKEIKEWLKQNCDKSEVVK